MLARLLISLAIGLGLFAVMTMVGTHSLGVLTAIAAGVCVLWLGWVAVDRMHGVRHRQPPA